MEQPPILPDREPGETAPSYGRRAHLMLLENPALLPDHHADAALDGWEPFESRRQKFTPSRWDFLTALVCIIAAAALAGLWPA